MFYLKIYQTTTEIFELNKLAGDDRTTNISIHHAGVCSHACQRKDMLLRTSPFPDNTTFFKSFAYNDEQAVSFVTE